MPYLRLLAFAAILFACTRTDRAASHAPSPSGARLNGAQFAPGSVAAAANGFWLDMVGVRRWYRVMAVMSRYVKDHPEYHFKVQMEFDRPMADYVAMIAADSILSTTLAQQEMSPTEFAVLTVATGSARLSQQLVDSLGPKGMPANLGGDFLQFWQANRAEIDSLDATLR